jgi:branched-subunit amino acid aminotransferase/4-amino-4-deoxychorismate lyase
MVVPEINQNYLFTFDKNVQCHEASHFTYFKIETLIKADEVFITNSLMEIMPVSRIEDYQIGRTVPGDITRQIMSAYKGLI